MQGRGGRDGLAGWPPPLIVLGFSHWGVDVTRDKSPCLHAFVLK